MAKGPFPRLNIRSSGFGVMSAALAFCHFVNAPGLIGVNGERTRVDYRIGVLTDSC